MDLSGIQTLLLKEYDLAKGLLFENHLYGCFALLEQHIDTPANVLDCSFSEIGVHHGFYKDCSANYSGSEAYQNVWLSLLASEHPLESSFVDSLEDAIFDSMQDISAVYFTAALETGELSEDLLKQGIASLAPVIALTALTALIDEEVTPSKRRKLPRTRNKQRLTPIHKSKRLSKTRKVAKLQTGT
jgi:hypothetical protein